jgi:Arc/MetJ-type ribon-helix-helix transcriptional regulator
MKVTVELAPEVEQWVSRKIETGQFASADEFVTARLTEDWLEEKIAEADAEPASPLTKQDWKDARQRFEESISKRR